MGRPRRRGWGEGAGPRRPSPGEAVLETGLPPRDTLTLRRRLEGRRRLGRRPARGPASAFFSVPNDARLTPGVTVAARIAERTLFGGGGGGGGGVGGAATVCGASPGRQRQQHSAAAARARVADAVGLSVPAFKSVASGKRVDREKQQMTLRMHAALALEEFVGAGGAGGGSGSASGVVGAAAAGLLAAAASSSSSSKTAAPSVVDEPTAIAQRIEGRRRRPLLPARERVAAGLAGPGAPPRRRELLFLFFVLEGCPRHD